MTHADGGTELPSGTVTFLFTDIEGSTRLLQDLGPRYAELLAHHRDLIDRAVSSEHGSVFGSEGDAVFAAFGHSGSAIRAAAAAQRSLADHDWPDGRSLRVRMGVHAGEVARLGSDYVGLTLHQVARISAAAHGGQVLVSETARALAAEALHGDLDVRDLGEHRLKDLARPERLYQLVGPGLDASFPPLRSLDARANNLPVQLTSFVGRGEVDTAAGLLGGTRLLTLAGPGGTGKTRLALQLAADVAEEFPDGVFFAGLDAVTDPALVPGSIAAALGVETGSAPPLDRLIDYVRDRRILLVLDNFEQVVDAAPAVARLLREATRLKVIVTSRIVLRLSGEQEFQVPPLGIPDPRRVASANDATGSEAVRLFVERAMAADPGFRLTDENARTVASIVGRLDGLPLAIELAAARVRVLPVDALLTRLDRSLTVLVGGARDLPTRQQTLRGAIDWSFHLLDEQDRHLFNRFAIFSGGACLTQAEAVCGPPGEIGREILDGLVSLAEKSLLRAEPGSPGEPRFAMLGTIREYALDQLDQSGEADELHRRHAHAYLDLVEAHAADLTGPGGGRLLDRLELDHDNLRAAQDWVEREGAADLGLRLLAAIWRFWQIRGHLHEADDRIRRLLGIPGIADQPPALRARAFGAAGSIHYWRGEFVEANAEYTIELEEARRTGDRATIAAALYDYAFASLPDASDQSQRYVAGIPWLEQALELFREVGDERGMAGALWGLSTGHLLAGDRERGRARLSESIAIYERLGDPFGAGWAYHMRGLHEISEGDPDAAEPDFRRALGIFGGATDLSAIVLLLGDFLVLARLRGDINRLWRLAGACAALRIRSGTDLVLDPVLALDWNIPRFPDDDSEAAALWREGEALSVEDAIAYALE